MSENISQMLFCSVKIYMMQFMFSGILLHVTELDVEQFSSVTIYQIFKHLPKQCSPTRSNSVQSKTPYLNDNFSKRRQIKNKIFRHLLDLYYFKNYVQVKIQKTNFASMHGKQKPVISKLRTSHLQSQNCQLVFCSRFILFLRLDDSHLSNFNLQQKKNPTQLTHV